MKLEKRWSLLFLVEGKFLRIDRWGCLIFVTCTIFEPYHEVWRELFSQLLFKLNGSKFVSGGAVKAVI